MYRLGLGPHTRQDYPVEILPCVCHVEDTTEEEGSYPGRLRWMERRTRLLRKHNIFVASHGRRGSGNPLVKVSGQKQAAVHTVHWGWWLQGLLQRHCRPALRPYRRDYERRMRRPCAEEDGNAPTAAKEGYEGPEIGGWQATDWQRSHDWCCHQHTAELLWHGCQGEHRTTSGQDMAKAIWASIMHRISTDDNPQHQFCPTGANSWCGWQKDQALGVQTYVHHDTIPMAVFKVVKPIYVSLSDKALLQRCLRGATQNQNEAFNGMVWHYCPKDGFASSEVVDMAANLAVARFNNGALILLAVLRKVGCNTAGNFTIRQLELEDKKRVEDAQSFASESKKRRRKTLRKRRKGFADQAAEQEGITYEAGAFWLVNFVNMSLDFLTLTGWKSCFPGVF